jgi:hypothetical protein
MAGTNGRSTRRNGHGPGAVPAPLLPDDEADTPPVEGIVPALASFEKIADASPLDVELRLSAFLGELGAGSPAGTDPGEPSEEVLVNGLVEVCLHHLGSDPPRVLLDFLWVVDAFGLGYLQSPLRERLRDSPFPSSPAWVLPVGRAEITGTHLVTHELGDGYDVAVTARHPGADADHVVAVYVDSNLGGLARDLLVHPDADTFLRMSAEAPGMIVVPVDPASAAASIDEALERTMDRGEAAPVADQFTSLFSIVEHYVAKLPTGGSPVAGRSPASPAEKREVVDGFLASTAGAAHVGSRQLLADAVEFVADDLGGDPLRWSPAVTHLVAAAWLPASDHGPDDAARLTAVLRDFLPWVHAAEGWGERYLSDALAVLEAVPDEAGSDSGTGRVEVLEAAVAAGVDLDDEAALDAFLDDYLEEDD